MSKTYNVKVSLDIVTNSLNITTIASKMTLNKSDQLVIISLTKDESIKIAYQLLALSCELR